MPDFPHLRNFHWLRIKGVPADSVAVVGQVGDEGVRVDNESGAIGNFFICFQNPELFGE